MAFNEQLPEWNATGVEPPASKKTEGWKPDDKPPADWFNWLFNRAYKVLDEIRTILGGHVDAIAPHSGHETPAGATAKASAAETNAKSYTDNHAESKATHGIGSGYYIAKTSRSDQLPAYADIQGKPSSFPPSTHTHKGSDITSKVSAASAADSVPWTGVTDKPDNFAPSAHKSAHASGGSDALSPADIGAATAAQGETADTAASDLAAHFAETVQDEGGVHGLVYEEGTWTPTLIGSTTAGSNTYTIQEGKYVAIGNLVTCFFRLELSVKDTAMQGDILLSGLPFAVGSDQSDRGSGAVAFYDYITFPADAISFNFYLRNSDNSAFILFGKGDNIRINCAPGNITDNTKIGGSITYRKVD